MSKKFITRNDVYKKLDSTVREEDIHEYFATKEFVKSVGGYDSTELDKTPKPINAPAEVLNKERYFVLDECVELEEISTITLTVNIMNSIHNYYMFGDNNKQMFELRGDNPYESMQYGYNTYTYDADGLNVQLQNGSRKTLIPGKDWVYIFRGERYGSDVDDGGSVDPGISGETIMGQSGETFFYVDSFILPTTSETVTISG